MAGVKGRSGRRSNSDEQKRIAVLQKAWDLIDKSLGDEKIPLSQRLEIAAKLVVKNIPTELAGSFEAKVTEMPAIQKVVPGEANANTNRIAEYIIGSPPPTEDT